MAKIKLNLIHIVFMAHYKNLLIQIIHMAHICENDMIQIKDMFQIVATWLQFSTEEYAQKLLHISNLGSWNFSPFHLKRKLSAYSFQSFEVFIVLIHLFLFLLPSISILAQDYLDAAGSL